MTTTIVYSLTGPCLAVTRPLCTMLHVQVKRPLKVQRVQRMNAQNRLPVKMVCPLFWLKYCYSSYC